MLNDQEIRDLVLNYGSSVNEGRSILQIIEDGDLPRLKGCTVLKGKVSDSVFGNGLVTKNGAALRLMFRNNRISTHDVNRGAIPFKDQVLAINHDAMSRLLKDVLGSSQFDVPGLAATSTVIPAENLRLIMLENVLRAYNAESSTSTSLYQHWLAAKNAGKESMTFAGHGIRVGDLEVNSRLPYVMDTPSTKDAVDITMDANALVEAGVCSAAEYTQIRNSSLTAFGVVTHFLAQRGMVLVDTKTEHGVNRLGHIVAADELYTMDSSRFWRMNDAGKIELREGKPVSFSKEFARGMVTEHAQLFTQEQSDEIAIRYIQGLQHLLGKEFVPDLRPRDERIIESTNLILDTLTSVAN